MAPEIQPVLNAADHALLLTPEQIRNRGASNTNVSFLRKTQYMTSQNARANDPLMRSASRSSKAKSAAKTAEPAVSRDDPAYIKRHIQKGFDVAYPNSAAQFNSNSLKPLPVTASDRDAWRNPTHPSNPKLKPVDFFPLLPDLPAKTDSDSFISVKLDKPPLPALPNGRRDHRIDVAILHPAKVDEVEREWKLRKEAHERNPDLYEDPGRLAYDWDFCVPRLEGSRGDKDMVERIRRKLNVADPRRDDEHLYLNRDKGRFEYERIRTFAEDSAPMTRGWRYLALSLFDPDTLSSGSSGGDEVHSRLKIIGQGKAAYYYQIGQRMRLKADRVKTLAQSRAHGGQAGKMAAVANENSVDGVDVLIREPDEDEMLMRAETRALVDRMFEEGSEELNRLRRRAEARDGEAEHVVDEQGAGERNDVDGEVGQNRHEPGLVNGRVAAADRADIEMLDADGDMDVDGDGDIDADGDADDA
jgi:RNA polymerase II-associated factor 1